MRFRKDILRTGSFWHFNPETQSRERWDVTDDTLRQIQTNFHLQRSYGGDCPVLWDHENTARGRLGTVVDTEVDNGVLYAILSAPTEEKALSIESHDGGVSVEVTDDWQDGEGHRFSGPCLTHLGVVNHPVVPGQQPFKRLSLAQGGSTVKKKFARRQLANGTWHVRQLAEGEAPAPDETPVEAASAAEAMPSATDATGDQIKPLFQQAFDLIATLLGNDGLKLGDVSDDMLLSEVAIRLNIMKGMVDASAPAEAASESAPMEDMAAAPVEEMTPAQLRIFAKIAKRHLSAVVARTAAEKQRAEVQRQAAFESRLDKLAASGHRIDKAKWMSIGKSCDYDESTLDAIASQSPTLKTSSQVRNLAGTLATTGDVKQMSHKEQREFGKRVLLGIMPKAGKDAN